jgi:hypothetical protein
MCPKVMDFVEILKIQLGRVAKDFKLIPLIFKKLGFDSEMKNPHHLKFSI